MSSGVIAVVYVTLWTLQAICAKSFANSSGGTPAFIALSALVEAFKLVCCSIFLAWQKRLTITDILKPSRYLFSAAACYNTYNWLMYVNIEANSLGTYKLFLSSRVPFAILFSFALFKRPPSTNQACGALLCMCGCALLTMFSCEGASNIFGLSSTLILMLQASMSSLGGALNEKALKAQTHQHPDNPLVELISTNVALYTWQLLISIPMCLLHPLSSLGHISNIITSRSGMIILLTSALAGLWTSVLLWRLNNVVKTVCTTVELITVSAASALIFSTSLPQGFFLAAICVIVGFCVFSATDCYDFSKQTRFWPHISCLAPFLFFGIALVCSHYRCMHIHNDNYSPHLHSRVAVNSSDWQTVWSRKGTARLDPPHILNGFDDLSEHDYQMLVESILNATHISLDPGANHSVLELGCGAGGFLKFMLSKYSKYHYEAVDFSETLLAAARKLFPAVNFRTQDLTKTLPYANHTFDMVLSFSVLFYMPSEVDVRRLVMEAHRVVKPNGIIFLGDISDEAKYKVAQAIRSITHKSVSAGPQHSYFPQRLFKDCAQQMNRPLRIIDENFVVKRVPQYLQALYRTSYVFGSVSPAQVLGLSTVDPRVVSLRVAQFPMLKGSALLEIGCGNGSFLATLSSRWSHLKLYCVEHNDNAIKGLVPRANITPLQPGNLLPYSDKMFTYVVSWNICQWPVPLEEILRVTKPDGYIYLSSYPVHNTGIECTGWRPWKAFVDAATLHSRWIKVISTDHEQPVQTPPARVAYAIYPAKIWKRDRYAHYPPLFSVADDPKWSLALWKSVDDLPLDMCAYIPPPVIDGISKDALIAARAETQTLKCPGELASSFSSFTARGRLNVSCPEGCKAQYRLKASGPWVNMADATGVDLTTAPAVFASCDCSKHLERFSRLHIRPWHPIDNTKPDGKQDKAPHVIMLIPDSVSRLRAERNWPNFLEWLVTSIPTTSYRYLNTNGANSDPNWTRLLCGMAGCKSHSLFDIYKRHNYTTMLALAWCPSSYGQVYEKPPDILLPHDIVCGLKGGDRSLPTDWYDSCLQDGVGRFSPAMLDWAGESIINMHAAGRRVFSVISPGDGHGVNDWSLLPLEKPLQRFYSRLKDAGVMNEAIVILTSDHGLHYENNGWMADVRATQAQRNPPLYISSVNTAFLPENVQRLVSHGDVYKTLLGLVGYGDNSTEPFCNLVSTEIPINRTCLDAIIPARWCKCWQKPEFGTDLSTSHHQSGNPSSHYWT